MLNSLFQTSESFWLDDIDFVFVQRENLQCIESFKCTIVNLRYAIMIQVQNQQMM